MKPRCYGFMIRAVANAPHPKKRETGGEDAYLAMQQYIGVADGVGSWGDRGVDAALYSRGLMRSCFEAAYEATVEGDHISTRDVLRRAARDCADIVGSSTAVLATMTPHGALEVCNLGDSGCLVVRGSEVIFRSEEMQHRLNFPFQLGTGSKDSAEDAVVALVDVKVEDIVCVATDGVLDNIFPDDIARTLHSFLARVDMSDVSKVQRALSSAAERLVTVAGNNAQDRQAATPFAEKCLEAGMSVEGGKVDDATVVLAVVSDAASYDSGARTNEHMADPPPPHAMWPM
jgi:protein phosphatase PTC7